MAIRDDTGRLLCDHHGCGAFATVSIGWQTKAVDALAFWYQCAEHARDTIEGVGRRIGALRQLTIRRFAQAPPRAEEALNDE